MFEGLPEDLCQNVVCYLPAPDVMTFLQLNKSWARLGKSEGFWRDLLLRDLEPMTLESIEDEGDKVQAAKKTFLTHAHATMLSSVKWCPLQNGIHSRNPSSREGHLMCALGDRVITTGGFCDDDRIHVLSLKPTDDAPKRWNAMSPRGQRVPHVYGASLTALDDHRAVVFGGFRAGGYSAECNQVRLLTLEEDNNCRWETIEPQGSNPATPRAYHSASLIHNRYLVLIGGMEERGSVLIESILDTKTWTWLNDPVSQPLADPKPSGRHGHSTVLDAPRNRLILFGGGSGSDLLRSGTDNTEVWELKFGSNWQTHFEQSFPWQWQRIYRDDNEDGSANQRCPLSPAETLCLGRCHVGAKVSRDTFVFACGSGHPTTNGVLAFDLKSDTFLRPRILGPLPTPRFTAAATVIGSEGWLLIHGGYSGQDGGALDDTILLDLAPGLKRSFGALPTATGWRVTSHRPVLDTDVEQGRAENSTNLMLGELVSAPLNQRRAMASQMLGQLMLTGQLGSRAAALLRLIASGSAVLGEEDDDDDDELDNSDEDYTW